MTVTETDPTTTDTSVDPTRSHETAVGGFAAIVGSGDHKTIGRLYVLTSLLFLLVTGVTGGLLGAERIDLSSSDDVLSIDVVAQVFSLHSIGGVFLFLFPLLIGLAMIIVPLQVGAATVAFPRAAAASFWTFLVSAALVEAAFAINGGPGGGDAEGVELFLVALFAVVVSHVVATVCVVTTVMTLRAPGMGLDRVPLFSWSNLVAGTIWLLTLPVFGGILVLLFVDHRYFREFTGGNVGIYDRLAWVFGQPTVYLFAIPVLGVIGDVIPVFARSRHELHKVAMGAIGAFAALSVGAWAQLGFTLDFTRTPGTPFTDRGPWIAFGVAAVLPVLALLGLWAQTLRKGTPRLGAPLVYALAAGFVLLDATIIGALVPIQRLELIGTAAASAHTHTVIVAVVLACFGGITYWAGKILGRPIPDVPSSIVAVVLALGGIVLVVPDVVAGFLGPDEPGDIESLNLISLVGGLLVIVGVLGFVALLFAAAASKQTAADDPWEGHTLEWATSSPPPVGNFAALPEVTSEAPLHDARQEASS